MLTLALTAGGLGWTGCTVSDPTIRSQGSAAPSAGRTPTPTPTPQPPDPAPAAAAAAELVLAATAGALAGGRTKLSERQRALVELLNHVHLERASALASPDPGSRPTGAATASPRPPAPVAKPSLGTMADAERRVARRCRT